MRDWIEIELGEIAKIYNGNSINEKVKEEKYRNCKTGLNYIGTKDVDFDGVIQYENGVKIPYDQPKFKIAPKGSVIVCSEGGSAGRKTGYVMENIYFGNKLFAIANEYSVFEGKYVYYYTRYKGFFEDFKNQMNGIIGGVSSKKFSNIKISLAPVVEQKAIVRKIEELFSSLDSGIADLKKAQEQLVIYRQSVLKKAFEGELTKEWREKQIDLPSADILLRQIDTERKRYADEQTEDWKVAIKLWEKEGKNGEKPFKPKFIREIKKFTDEELQKLPRLNDYWQWVKIDKVAGHDANSLKAGPFGSSLKKESYTKSGFKIYGQEQVISGNHTIGNYYVDQNKYNSLINCAIKPFDILISLVGTVGKVLVLPKDCKNGIINPRLVKITLNNFYNPTFFKYYFESAFLKNIYSLEAHGATMDVLNLGIIKDLPYPLASVSEQHQIVREIESRLSVCDKVEESLKESLEKAKALRQSILKKAFEGKLLSKEELAKCKVDQDYEPASVLLEKIKKEKKKNCFG